MKIIARFECKDNPQLSALVELPLSREQTFTTARRLGILGKDACSCVGELFGEYARLTDFMITGYPYPIAVSDLLDFYELNRFSATISTMDEEETKTLLALATAYKANTLWDLLKIVNKTNDALYAPCDNIKEFVSHDLLESDDQSLAERTWEILSENFIDWKAVENYYTNECGWYFTEYGAVNDSI